MRKIYNQETGELIWTIDKDKKVINYFPSKKKSNQATYLHQVTFKGFEEPPSGLNIYREGYGFKGVGRYVLSELRERFGDSLQLIIENNARSRIDRLKTKVKVTFDFKELKRLLAELGQISKEKNKASRQITKATLHNLFPRYFKKAGMIVPGLDYTKDKITKLFESNDNLVDQLSKNDINTLAEFYPSFLEKHREASTVTHSLQIATQNKQITEKIYLEQVIVQFEKKLNRSVHKENEWQEFLRKYILLFNTNYVSFLDRVSVAILGKYPDFMLLDVYDYIDIFEIKKPDTNLLKYDDSRENYYWDVEVNRAIIQTEKYIESLTVNSLRFADEVRRKYKTLIRVVRPRGIIIAGIRSQLKGENMEDDFRLLSNSLKNIDIVLYDDLLNNLKNLKARFSNGDSI